MTQNQLPRKNMLDALVPQVKSAEKSSETFEIKNSTRIVCTDKAALSVGELMSEYLSVATGFGLPVVVGEEIADGDMVLSAESECGPGSIFNDESYTLSVKETQVRISALTSAGLARGIQTFRQLCPPEIFSDRVIDAKWEVPGVEISDAPKYPWRGLHLDVSRHFFSVKEVKRFIDLLALHRMNVLHLHLTDDQGWRVEIKKYPKLTEIGAKRRGSMIGHYNHDRPHRFDDVPVEGHFTQEDIREIVNFAAKRAVVVMPEIDIPGHMQAALAAYPELGNYPDNKISVRQTWGISSHILSPRKSSVQFVIDVMADIIEMFPSEFIHIGGDEAIKTEWQDCREVQDLLIELGLKNEEQLQSWFLRQVSEFLHSRGRRVIGWDEILEGGLSEGMAVMSWRNDRGAVEAARQGHDSVMCDNAMTYFDSYQADPEREPLAIGGDIPCEKIYRFNPIPKDLEKKLHKHILGAQGQLWTEYIPNFSHLEYMAYPRACALAEKLWCNADECHFIDFAKRLRTHRSRFAALGVNAHPLP